MKGYMMLPLGQRVLTKVSRLIDEEMERVGALRLSMQLLLAHRELRIVYKFPWWLAGICESGLIMECIHSRQFCVIG